MKNYPKYVDSKGAMIQVGDIAITKSFSDKPIEICVEGVYTGQKSYKGLHLPTGQVLYNTKSRANIPSYPRAEEITVKKHNKGGRALESIAREFIDSFRYQPGDWVKIVSCKTGSYTPKIGSKGLIKGYHEKGVYLVLVGSSKTSGEVMMFDEDLAPIDSKEIFTDEEAEAIGITNSYSDKYLYSFKGENLCTPKFSEGAEPLTKNEVINGLMKKAYEMGIEDGAKVHQEDTQKKLQDFLSTAFGEYRGGFALPMIMHSIF